MARSASRCASTLTSVLLALTLVGVASAQEPSAESDRRPQALIVKLRGEGSHAVTECAERIFSRNGSFREATADSSRSLDDGLRRAGVRRIRAMFRSADGRSFAQQRRKLRERLSRRLSHRVSRRSPERVDRRASQRATPPDLAHVYRVELREDVSLEESLELLRRDPHVAYVQRDNTNVVDQIVEHADDPFLYSTGSWGQDFDDLWGLRRIRAPEAWSISRGAGVVVAVVDTGLDYEHPDIAANVWVNPGEDLDGNGRVDASDWNGVDDDDNGFVDDLRGFDFASSLDADQDGNYDGPADTSDPDPFDDRGHGTHVAGIIAAVANNGIGIAGVAPEARIMPVKGFLADGPGRDSDLWRGVLYAAENGASVINTSWSCLPFCPENPLAQEIVALVHAMDVVIVTSAGNRLSDVVFNSPEHLRETITVASSGVDDAPSSSFTNRGWLVDLAAPGGGPSDDPNVRIARRNILSLRSSADLSAAYATVAEGYWRTSGTSMSAPQVAGAVALLRSARPELGYEEVRRILRETAVDTGPPGHDGHMGAGRLDAFAAVDYPPLPDLRAALTDRQGATHRPGPGRTIEVRGTAAGGDFERFGLSYGLGNEPTDWRPIAASEEPIENGVLAAWPLDEVGEGTYVVRLTVLGRSGAEYDEFLVLSLEHNESTRVSSEGPPAGAPSISGKLVVWQSKRSASDPPEETEDLNLFASSFDGTRHVLVSDAPGHQQRASVSARTIGWMDSRNQLTRPEIFGCQLRNGRCNDFEVSAGGTVSLPPATTPGRIFWLGSQGGQINLLSCRADGDSCALTDSGLEPMPRGFLRGDGSELVWTETAGRVGLCRVDRQTGACEPESPADAIWPVSQPTSSSSLLAWVADASRRNRRSLRVCELDPSSGACPAVEVARDVEDPTPALSGNRLVWDETLGSEASDVFYCEFDAVLQQCPVQRITAQHAPQQNAAIDGRRLVWEDERNGAAEIRGILLPELAPLRDHTVREGAWIRFGIQQRVAGPQDERLSLSVESADGRTLEELGIRFRQIPGRWASGRFEWQPGRGQAGRYPLSFVGSTQTGLRTRQTIIVDVLPGKNGPRIRSGLRD